MWDIAPLPLQMLMSLEIPSKDYAYQWVMISGHLKDAILNVFHSLRATFGQFLRIHGLYQLLPGYAFLKPLSWLNLQLSEHVFFWRLGQIDDHGKLHGPVFPKILMQAIFTNFQSPQPKATFFFWDLMDGNQSWFPGGLATKVMQWMVANRIHGSRHLGVETTYSKATLEGFENSLKVLWSFSFLLK